MKLAQKLVINYFRAKLNILSVISKRKAAVSAFNLFCTPLRRPKRIDPPVFTTAEILNFKLDGYHLHGYRWNYPSEKKFL